LYGKNKTKPNTNIDDIAKKVFQSKKIYPQGFSRLIL